MPKPKKGPRLGGSPAHQRLMLANLATSLFEHGAVTTTEAKARQLRPFAERPGGYTRITKIGPRKGDNAPMAVIELVEEEYAPKSRASKPTAEATPAPAAVAEPPEAEVADVEPAGAEAPVLEPTEAETADAEATEAELAEEQEAVAEEQEAVAEQQPEGETVEPPADEDSTEADETK